MECAILEHACVYFFHADYLQIRKEDHMRDKYLNILLLMLGYGCLASVFPPLRWTALLFVGWIPILYVYFFRKTPLKYIYFSAVTYYFVTFFWMFRSTRFFFVNYLTIPILCFAIALYHVFPFLLEQKLTSEKPFYIRILLLAASITGCQWIQGYGELACPFGNPAIQLIDLPFYQNRIYLFDIWLHYFLIIFFSGIAALFIHQKHRKRSFKNLKIPSLTAVVILVIMTIASYISPIEYEKEKELRCVLMQPNIDLKIKWDPNNNSYMIWEYLDQLRSNHIISEPGIDTLVVLPETSCYNTDASNPTSIPEELVAYCRKNSLYLLVGVMNIQGIDPDYNYYNSAIFYDPYTDQLLHHHKLRPVPFVEAPPWANHFPFLKTLYKFIVTFDRGESYSTFEINDIKIAPLVCFESTLSDLIDNYLQAKPDVFITLTNDSWFDHSCGVDHHFDFTRYQSIRTGIPFMQCANSGITGAVSPDGKVMAQIEPDKTNLLDKNFKISCYNGSLRLFQLISLLFPLSTLFLTGAYIWKRLISSTLKNSKRT